GPFDPFAVYGAHNGRINGPLAAAVAGPRLDGTRSGRWREAATFRFDLPPAAAAQRADLATYLPDEILVKVDRATMAFGIEARVPLLDKRLVELAFRIEPSLHRRGGERKALLKAAARRWLPPSILTPRKRGFSPPLNEWLEDPPLRRRMVETVRDGRLAGEGFIDASGLDRKIDGLRRPQGGLLLLYLLERWAQRWVYAPAAVEPRMAAQ
ncbi:MAG: asparagine synthase C-terminal domain-containing protein, partial [Pseudomonadota bacterium]